MRGRGETGRRTGLKIPRPLGHAGSSPAVRTILTAVSIGLALAACERRPDDIPVEASIIGGPARPSPSGREPATPAFRALLGATAQGLVRFDGSGGIEPGLAERWIVIDDGRSYIFRLGDAEWPNGTAATADEVVPALRKAVRESSALHPFLGAIDEIVAMTPQVIEVRLSRPRPDLLKLFAQPEFAIPAPKGPGGSGPFRIASSRGGVLTLRPAFDPGRDPDEDSTEPQPETFVRLRGERASTAILRFAAKRSDLVDGGTVNDWPLLANVDIAPANIRTDAAEGLFGLAFVHRDGLFADRANRMAIAMAIDAAAVTAAIRADWPAIDTQLPGRLDSAADPAPVAWAGVAPADRVATARARIAKASVGRHEPVVLRVALPSTPGGTLLFGQIGAALRRIGTVPVRVAPGEAADLRLIDTVAPYDSARWYLRTACQPCGESAAALVDQARNADTLGERARLIAAADAALAADVSYIPIARPLRWSLVANRLRAWAPNARAVHPLNHLRADTN